MTSVETETRRARAANGNYVPTFRRIIPVMSSSAPGSGPSSGANSSPKRRVRLDDPRLDRDDPYLRILCVNIYVRDQDKSLHFFVDQLGFSLLVDDNYDGANRWVAVSPPDGNTVLSLVAPGSKSPDHKLIGHGKHTVLVTEDVERKYKEWRKRGVKFHSPPQTTLWGGIVATFEDVDGNGFALIGLDAFVRELEAQRSAAAEKLEAERRAAQELEIAKQVQARLFPQNSPPLRTLDYAGICIQARQVGGDYYDFLNLGRERLGFVIGDTSGKGIGAALLMANLQANLRSQSAIALEQPQNFLKSVNQLFYANTTDNSYATLVFAEYDDASRRIRYANCGHYPGLLFRGDKTLEKLESTSTVLGLFDEWECTLAESQLSSGDTLVLYTDGVTDTFNDKEEDFGEEGLIEVVRKNCKLAPQAMLAAIVDEVRRFSPQEQHDDVTMIVAKCR
jgi:serine phosphatase RsbU (regulator of sigma subunit)/predicted enzyme related to lactoylglutathione lyase